MKSLPRNTVLPGDARTVLADLLPESVDAVVTSPPYFHLRDYGASGQLGLEQTITEWVAELRAVCRLLGRVLKPYGSLWLNVGDAYSRSAQAGAPPKGLLLGPERLLLALAADGWLVRGKVIWAKQNPMPESVRDRLAKTWEPLYHLTRSPDAYFDLDAIRVPHRGRTRAVAEPNRRYGGAHGGLVQLKARGRSGHRLGKNPGDVWSLPKGGYRGAHFATFPAPLVERPILATVPERICVQCDRPWQRQTTPGPPGEAGTVGALRRCDCFAPSRPGLVLDPFFGAGTVAVVAERLNRDWLGIELNPTFTKLAEDRLRSARKSRRVGGRLGGGRKGHLAFLPAASAIHDHPKGGEYRDQGPGGLRARRGDGRLGHAEGGCLQGARQGVRPAGQLRAGQLLQSPQKGERWEHPAAQARDHAGRCRRGRQGGATPLDREDRRRDRRRQESQRRGESRVRRHEGKCSGTPRSHRGQDRRSRRLTAHGSTGGLDNTHVQAARLLFLPTCTHVPTYSLL
ncbi:MAG: DNA-methyltransferase [Mycobacteriales bacterium]